MYYFELFKRKRGEGHQMYKSSLFRIEEIEKRGYKL